MANDVEQLRSKLEHLQQQLAAADTLKPETREQLAEILSDVQRVLGGTSGKGASISARLSEAALEFEEQHPTLAGTLASVIDALSRMGI
jgi:hypothetical protein